jgi:hypothetical protein
MSDCPPGQRADLCEGCGHAACCDEATGLCRRCRDAVVASAHERGSAARSGESMLDD